MPNNDDDDVYNNKLSISIAAVSCFAKTSWAMSIMLWSVEWDVWSIVVDDDDDDDDDWWILFQCLDVSGWMDGGKFILSFKTSSSNNS